MYHIQTDTLGTPRTITNAIDGSLVWSWDNSEAFGNNSNTNTGLEFNLRFSGQYFDEEKGSSYNINRDYASGLGRYIQSDPIGLNGGINTYGYVQANPLSYNDPMGLIAPALIPVGLGAGINAVNVYSSGNKSAQQIAVGAIIGGLAGAAVVKVTAIELGFFAASASYGGINAVAGMANRLFADTKSDPDFTKDTLINFSTGAIAGGSCAIIGKYMGSTPINHSNLSSQQTGQKIGGEVGSLNASLFFNTTINYKDTLTGQP